MAELFEKISEAVIAANAETVNKLVQEALDKDIVAKDILDNGLTPGMDIVGQRMKTGEMFIPEVLRSAKVMQAAMEFPGTSFIRKREHGIGNICYRDSGTGSA